jgi:molybdate transport system substrate-binding protein
MSKSCLFVVLAFALAIAPKLLAQNTKAGLTVSAAVSLKDALEAIQVSFAKERPAISLHYNLGASGTLQQQIEQGAPVDIYISASPDQMDALESQGFLLPGTRRNLLRNSMVLIVPAGAPAIPDFQVLLNPQIRVVALGEPQAVPAGKYAQEILRHFGLYERLTPKLVFAKDVRQVLTYVATGNADAGLVYATDAKISSQVKVSATAPPESHDPIVYPVAILKETQNAAAAKEFVAFLESPEAQADFAKFGFSPENQ